MSDDLRSDQWAGRNQDETDSPPPRPACPVCGGGLIEIRAAERGDFAAARRWHQALIPLMLTNFVESNPIPVKTAMAAMGLCEEVFRLPMVPPGDAARRQIQAVLKDLGLLAATEVRA